MSGSANRPQGTGELVSPTFLPPSPFSPSFDAFINFSNSVNDVSTAPVAALQAPSTNPDAELELLSPSAYAALSSPTADKNASSSFEESAFPDADPVLSGNVDAFLDSLGLYELASSSTSNPYLTQDAPVWDSVDPFAADLTNRALGSPLRTIAEPALAPDMTSYFDLPAQQATAELWNVIENGQSTDWQLPQQPLSAFLADQYLGDVNFGTNLASADDFFYADPTTANQTSPTPYFTDSQWNTFSNDQFTAPQQSSYCAIHESLGFDFSGANTAAPQARMYEPKDFELTARTGVNPSLLLAQPLTLTDPVMLNADPDEFMRFLSNSAPESLASVPSTSTDKDEQATAPTTGITLDESLDLSDDDEALTAHKRTYTPERPQKPSDQPWIRTNKCTQGKSTRTGKINHYDPSSDGRYIATPTPFAPRWTAPTGDSFAYNQWGELAQRGAPGQQPATTYTAAQLEAFILHHPTTAAAKGNGKPAKLTLWLQRTPADSAKRYPTLGGPRCRFHACPASAHNRNIGVGHYRVALDERWSSAGVRQDPFVVAGYVHLYCLERFCDFAAICRSGDVRADGRAMPSEPRGRFAAALEGDEYEVAAEFIAAAGSGKLARKFPGYPVHEDGAEGAAKPHEKTLTYALTQVKNATVNKSKRRMLEARGLKASHIFVHKGDLAMQVGARQEETKRKREDSVEDGRRAKRPRRSVVQLSDDESEGEDDVQVSVEPAAMVAVSRPRRAVAVAVAAGKKRKIVADDGDDEDSLFEDSDADADYVPGDSVGTARRRSKRRRSV